MKNVAGKNFDDSGILLVRKEAGISSNAVVQRVKHSLLAKKCGHLGTLDLEAEGLLLVTVNSATKLFDYFLCKDKTYEAVFEFGTQTDTLDLSGQVTARVDCDVCERDLVDACKSFSGKYMQMPPQFSAKKVGGKVAYNEARAGRTLELAPKEVEIFSMKVLGKVAKNVFRLEISCSSGTYIRAIARDLAKKLDTVGFMRSLVRTRCGKFLLENAFSLQQVERGEFELVPCEKVFDLPSLELEKSAAEKLLNGQSIDVTLTSCARADNQFKLFCEQKFLGVGEVVSGRLKFKLRLV